MRNALVPALLVVAAQPLAAGDAPKPAAPAPAEVAGAVDRGAAWLRERFASGFDDDTWHGQAELVVLALAHAGSNAADPAFTKGLAALEASRPRFTYRTSLLAMALAEANPLRYREKIAHCAQWLVDTQLAGGEWGYPGAPEGSYAKTDGVEVEPPPRADPPPPASARVAVVRRRPVASHGGAQGDFSNTQFAVLGLRACREAGVDVPAETWKAALDYVRRHQRPDGGWGYVIGGAQDDASYASLTCAGACSVAIALDALGTKDVRSDPSVRKALLWLRRRLDVGRNVGIDESAVLGPRSWQHYHLYSLERAAQVLGLKEVEGRAWYPLGARWLLDRQRADGSWLEEGGRDERAWYPVVDTCFALLFLTKATRPLTR